MKELISGLRYELPEAILVYCVTPVVQQAYCSWYSNGELIRWWSMNCWTAGAMKDISYTVRS